MVKTKLNGYGLKYLVLALAVALTAILAAGPAPAEAHCDSVNGPVVTAAQDALAKGDVSFVLPYVQPEAEAELTAAFEQALKVRKQGGAAAQLAETYFYETAVRLHRVGEGAPYTGLKKDADFGPALEAADVALENGSVKGVNAVLEKALRDGLAAKFDTVTQARAAAAKAGSVEAHRERVEAELLFEKYVLELYTAITAETPHGEGETASPTAGAHGH